MTECAKFEPLVAASRLGVLDRNEELAVATHLAGCDPCQALAAGCKEALDASRRDESGQRDGPDDAVWDRLAKEIEGHRTTDEQRAKIRVNVACTYCHAGLERADAAFCASCLAPHHSDCFEQHGRCAAPGCDEKRFVRPQLARPPKRNGTRGVLLVALAVGGLGWIAALTLGESAPLPSRETRPAPVVPVRAPETPPPPAVEPPPLAPPRVETAPPIPAEAPRPAPQAPPSKKEEAVAIAPVAPDGREVQASFVTLPPGPDLPELPALPALPGGRVVRHAVNVAGIPAECEMSLYRLARKKDPKLETLSSALMIGGWAPQYVFTSPDGSIALTVAFDGFELRRNGTKRHYRLPALPNMRFFFWANDSRRFAFWHPDGIAVANVDELGVEEQPRFRMVYKFYKGRRPFAVEWASDEELLVVEHLDTTPFGTPPGSAIQLVNVAGGVRELVHSTQPILFVSAQRSGDAATLLYATEKALHFVDRKGAVLGEVPLPGSGIQDLVWSPGGRELAINYRQESPTDPSKVFRGVYLLRFGVSRAVALEQVTPTLEVQNMRFSPDGDVFAYQTMEAVTVRPVKPGDKVVTLTIDAGALGLPAKTTLHDVAFDDAKGSEDVTIAAGNALFEYDLEKRTVRRLAHVGDAERTFATAIEWHADGLVFTSYTNTAKPRKKRATPPK